MKSSVQFSPNKYLENISRMFKKLYNDEQLADVTLICKDGTIKAHKLILATCSPYFHKIFTENNRDHPILIMHGVSYQILHDLIELIYKGNVDVLPESLNPLYELAGEFQLSGISGVLREEGDKLSEHESSPSDSGSHGRDTRFKGLKRVAVDYRDTDSKNDNSATPPKRLDTSKEEITDLTKNETTSTTSETLNLSGDNSSPELIEVGDEDVTPQLHREESPKLSAWALKQRKFQCVLCPSSFKRSSHLTRHQLVHTGERPFACDRCDKAFSRHDKLKHHIRKAHEMSEYDASDYNLEMSRTLSIPSPTSPLPFIISHIRSEAEDEIIAPNPAKRPRGRPRKYPVVEKPVAKRGRGRPRLNPVREEANGENYDITNLPYGDLDYLTMPLQDSVMIEPFVEIKTEKEENSGGNEKDSTEKKDDEVKEAMVKADEEEVHEIEDDSTSAASLKILENRIAKIGECTISVANH